MQSIFIGIKLLVIGLKHSTKILDGLLSSSPTSVYHHDLDSVRSLERFRGKLKKSVCRASQRSKQCKLVLTCRIFLRHQTFYKFT